MHPDLARRRACALVAGGLVLTSLLSLGLLLFLGPSGIPPHIASWRPHPGLVWLHLTGDVLTWASFAVIPFLALYVMIVGRVSGESRFTFPTILGWGALFIWSCGQARLLDALEIWYEVQWVRGVVKVWTGVIAWVFVGLVIQQRKNLISVARAIHRASVAEGGEGA